MSRTKIGLSATLAVLALVFAAAGVLRAQQGGSGRMGMMSMMADCPMMQAMQESPGAVLKRQGELGLSADQVSRLQALERAAGGAPMQGTERMRALHQEIARVTNAERFDEAAARAALDRMGDLHTEMGVAMLRTRHQVRQILTPTQREKLAAQGGGMMGMHRRMMGGGMDMENCPMMQGGMNSRPQGRAGSR